MSKSTTFLSTKDFLVSMETFDIIDTKIEGLLETHPQPKPEDLAKYYASEEYISHTDKKKGLLSWVYQLVKKLSIQQKTRLIFKQNAGVGSLLDIGAGTGDFLKYANNRGWEIYGVEPNSKASSLALKKGVSLRGSLFHFKEKQFDVITMWHVLEHIPNLEETIKLLSTMVKPKGSLIIAVPNYKSFDAKYYKEVWAAYDVPRHLWHFSKDSIEELFKEKFRLEKTLPMIFDSFYVSLLSEKYKRGSRFSLKGLGVGLVSNFKGMATKEYSSHIYCLRKNK